MAEIEPAARRYARAAFELAQEKGAVLEWTSAIDQIAQFMMRPDVRNALSNTRFSQESKQKLVEAGLGDLPPLPLNFARLLVRKSRARLIADIASVFHEMVEAQRGIARATAHTAIALTDVERDALVLQLRQRTGKDVVLQTEVDPSLLGGVVIQIGDRLIDGSTKAKLEALRQSLVGAVG